MKKLQAVLLCALVLAVLAAAYAVGALAAGNVVCGASRIMRGKITAEEE